MDAGRIYRFQLHHTGIKTGRGTVQKSRADDFNCTIQELKRQVRENLDSALAYFNCTIQELKPQVSEMGDTNEKHFNCTIQELKLYLNIHALPF